MRTFKHDYVRVNPCPNAFTVNAAEMVLLLQYPPPAPGAQVSFTSRVHCGQINSVTMSDLLEATTVQSYHFNDGSVWLRPLSLELNNSNLKTEFIWNWVNWLLRAAMKDLPSWLISISGPTVHIFPALVPDRNRPSSILREKLLL